MVKKSENKVVVKKDINKSITDFLNIEYLNYSLATVGDRAIPSICDGFKPGARKIVHAMFEGSLKNGSTSKLLALVGDTMKISLYAHGDASLVGTTCTLAKAFYNFYNPLEIEGQGGYLRSPEAGAPRYLYIRKSKYADLVYKADYDLLKYVFEEGDYVEPEHYLPIVPTVLSNTTMGIANGYSFHSNAWNPVDVLDCCLEILKSKKGIEKFKTVVRPYLRDIPQDNWKLESGQWYCYGEWKTNQAKDLMTITNLPSDTTYVEFEKLLNRLCDKQEIKDYKDLSEDGNVHYEVQFFKGQLAKEIKSDRSGKRLANKFKLIKKLPDDLLWLLDENGKLKYFKDRYEVIKYFVNWRLTVYVERKKKLVKILEEKYKNNSELVKFIELVCKGKLKIRNRSKVDIKPDMDAQHLPMALLATPMSKVTIEERDELLKQNEEIKKHLEYIKNTTEKQMYINDLELLKRSLIKDDFRLFKNYVK